MHAQCRRLSCAQFTQKVTGVTFATGLKADGLPLSTGVSFDTSTLNLAAAVYHASFGAGLYADPNCFAESGASPLKYTADTEGPVGSFLGRSFGAMMLGMGSIALFDKESEGVTKMFAVIMSLFCPIMAANTKEDSAGAGHTQMWKLQVINVGNVLTATSCSSSSPQSPPSPSTSPPLSLSPPPSP